MNRLSLLLHVALICAFVCVTVAPPPEGKGRGPPENRGNGNGGGNGNGKGKGKGPYRGDQPQLEDDAVKQLQDTWKNCKGKGKCQQNANRHQKVRNAVKASLKKDRRGGEIRGQDDATIERRFQKAHNVKKAIFARNGLSDVDVPDNGLIGGDMLLSEEQLDKMASGLQGVTDAASTGDVPLVDAESVQLNPLTGTASRKKRGDTLALDYYGGNKWPTTTINFYIDSKEISSTEANIVRNALKSIQSVSCLKFVEGWKYPVMEFVRAPSDTDEGTCGWSDVGYKGNYNAVNINFDSSVCKSTLQGVVVHEALHSLGFAHEHTRYDRDRYLKIDWKNVDPQSYDVYNKDDPTIYNPYCVSFDPLSIMHYDPYVGALDSSKAVMTPVSFSSFYLPRMGMGTAMAASDVRLLNKMYCKTSTCKDKSVNCGWTACGSCSTYGSVCPKSCDKC